jgi:GNAT superfamily N-acetyltransferase
VVTHADYRKRGLAGECLAYAKTIAVSHGCYKMMLMTGSKSAGTLQFYKKCGYNADDKTAFVQWLK